MEYPSDAPINTLSPSQPEPVQARPHHSGWKALSIEGGIAIGGFPMITMIVFLILASNTFHTNKHISLHYYILSMAVPIYSFIPVLISSIICRHIKGMHLVGKVALILLIGSLPLLGLMLIGLAFGSDGYLGISAVPFLAGPM